MSVKVPRPPVLESVPRDNPPRRTRVLPGQRPLFAPAWGETATSTRASIATLEAPLLLSVAGRKAPSVRGLLPAPGETTSTPAELLRAVQSTRLPAYVHVQRAAEPPPVTVAALAPPPGTARFVGLEALGAAEDYGMQTVLVDGVETDIRAARVIAYDRPEAIVAYIRLVPKGWVPSALDPDSVGGASMRMRQRMTEDARRSASYEEKAAAVAARRMERALYDEALAEIQRAGWKKSQYNANEWYMVDAQGRALKPTKKRSGTLEEMLEHVRGTRAPSASSVMKPDQGAVSSPKTGRNVRVIIRHTMAPLPGGRYGDEWTVDVMGSPEFKLKLEHIEDIRRALASATRSRSVSENRNFSGTMFGIRYEEPVDAGAIVRAIDGLSWVKSTTLLVDPGALASASATQSAPSSEPQLAPGFKWRDDEHTQIECEECGHWAPLRDPRVLHSSRCSHGKKAEYALVRNDPAPSAPSVIVPRGVKTNLRAQACERCRVMVAPGQGRLEPELDAQDEPTGQWLVTCLDEAACAQREREFIEAKQADRDTLTEWHKKLDALARSLVVAFQGAERPRAASIARGAQVYGAREYDARKWHVEPEGTPERKIWQVTYNGKDGDDWSWNNLNGHSIAVFVPYSPVVEDMLGSWQATYEGRPASDARLRGLMARRA